MAVAVRAIATRELDGTAARRAVLRETLAGLINGLIIGVGVGVAALIWFQDVKLAGVIAVAFRSLLFQPFFKPTETMNDTLLVGDHLFVNRYLFAPAASGKFALLKPLAK